MESLTLGSCHCRKADDDVEDRQPRRPFQPWPLHAAHFNLAKRKLELEDLSHACRRDSFCFMCVHAFCSHCCRAHHGLPLYYHVVIPINVDASTGKPIVPEQSPGWCPDKPSLEFVANLVNKEDYSTNLPRNAYCMRCCKAFPTALCHHHEYKCGTDAILRIAERDGQHCTRCTGNEPWDPLAIEEDDNGKVVMLLPVLRRSSPDVCVQCGGQVLDPKRGSLCSLSCDAAHSQDVAQRRERRDSARATQHLAKLRLDSV
uniref:Uncharacterized protein n=1 Tax=Leersia perrieri TaxID=77586 RepID=A0A0D9UYP0_9ORYZ